ncbi:hypothetical protein CK503_05300 [Aliifodinibius salipaludis]|uniref:Bacterial repeat domain-containing protein n=1 Tax=Fodinibius salipaludis TaxID=2032627 RepID=A0A2A2GC14_9BACT|nr:BspA family leucine-rich repeat surface protein [Aliifodinibius salipaludis]PAU94888.1 hypothetical protein CK503_05300 [Aliifodinibius salipaludis]
MRRLLYSSILVLLTISFISCGGDSGTGPDPDNDNEGTGGEEATTYTVEVSAADGGSVSPSGSNEYEEGEEIEIEASANDEYLFSEWTGDTESEENPLSLTVDQDYSLTANFEKKSYSLTTNTEGDGAIDENVIEEKSTDYESGTVVELTANPADGYKFVEWKGDLTGTDNPQQITVDSPKEVTAVFEKKTYSLTTNTEGEGAIDENVVQEKSTDYEHGTVVELTANPGEGYKFVEWKGDLSGTDNPQQITVDSPKEVTAVFEKKSFALTTNTSGSGSITKSPDQSTYEYGTTVELEAVPADGHVFVEWTGAIASADNPVQLTVDEEKEMTAVFEEEQAKFYLASNGVTIKCEAASVGDTGTVDGVTYTKRSADQITTDNAPTTCTSGTTDMSELFKYEDNFNGDIGHWDVSSVTNMHRMFTDADDFNQDLNSWDVSNVTDMSVMFASASKFNGNISGWDISSVTDMSAMFNGALSFNGDLSDWDVSSVTDMSSMFRKANDFNGDISVWDVLSVTDMSNMFSSAASFNQNIGSWAVNNVTDMSRMFYETDSFDQDLDNWDVSSVENMDSMFAYSTFDGIISNWNVSNVTNMDQMFYYGAFNRDISGWCVEKIYSEPDRFSEWGALEESHKPEWGTCP